MIFLKNKSDLKKYGHCFDFFQKYQIRKGLEQHLDISKYAILNDDETPVFECYSWEVLRALEKGEPVANLRFGLFKIPYNDYIDTVKRSKIEEESFLICDIPKEMMTKCNGRNRKFRIRVSVPENISDNNFVTLTCSEDNISDFTEDEDRNDIGIICRGDQEKTVSVMKGGKTVKKKMKMIDLKEYHRDQIILESRLDRIVFLDKDLMTQEEKDMMNNLWMTKDIKVFRIHNSNLLRVEAQNRKTDNIIDEYWPCQLYVGWYNDYICNVQFVDVSIDTIKEYNLFDVSEENKGYIYVK